MFRRFLAGFIVLAYTASLHAADLPVVKVELQPLAAQAKRIVDALQLLGEPLTKEERAKLADATKDKANGAATIQNVLDKHCLAAVTVEGLLKPTVKTQIGPVHPELAQQGWRVFLVKVINPAEMDNVQLRAISPNALPVTKRSSNKPDPTVTSVGEVEKRFLELSMYDTQPLLPKLSGLEVEYRIIQVYSRDAGRKEATLGFGLWKPGQRRGPALARSATVPILFEAQPAVVVRLRVSDFDGASRRDGKPIMGSFTFKDDRGRVYPSPSRRLAPDFNFHHQIYRADGESILLQPGNYTVNYARGPEYLLLEKKLTIPKATKHEVQFALKRWVHPATKGWYSGDHHIHAAGCAHYESPTEGVTPADMMRHVLGEDVNVGCCLSWGPCWYHQKRYFDGKVHPLSTSQHLLRYDVEVSGFPSSHCGHLCLLRLREQDYPGTKLINDWPSWDLPILKWSKSQGGVVGFAHSGWGLDVGATKELPNFIDPPMSGIGANEYVVDITHNACDFISTVDTPSVWELNMWYHTLNCGYRCRVSGETDFPCIYGERVGLGRSYVHLPGKLDFDKWAQGIKDGRCYVSDGKSHLMDFSLDGLGVGLKKSEIRLDKPGKVEVKASVAAYLEPEPTPTTEAIRSRPLNAKPYWDVERARIGKSRKVPVEVVVNGVPVAKKELLADGKTHEMTFEVPIEKSSWVCLRIFPTSHTNPVFVLVDGKPIRADKRSAEWCLRAVDKCWEQKSKRIRKEELADAKKAYDHAREAYRKIIAESE